MEHDHRQNIDLIRIILINLIDKETVRVMDAHYVALQPLVGHECTCIEYGFTIIAQQITNHILFKQFKFSFLHTRHHIFDVFVCSLPVLAMHKMQSKISSRLLLWRRRQCQATRIIRACIQYFNVWRMQEASSHPNAQ
eukprot:930152_1